MNVEQLMMKGTRTCCPEESLNDAAQIMWEGDCGCVPVVSGKGETKLLGVITDRDICMAAYTQGKTLGEMPVHSAMAHRVFTCSPDDTIAAAEQIMREARVRRLPVVDESGQLLGLISLADIAREAAREQESKNKRVTHSEIGETLSAICEPRCGEVVVT